jgi:hypothetical protein
MMGTRQVRLQTPMTVVVHHILQYSIMQRTRPSNVALQLSSNANLRRDKLKTR